MESIFLKERNPLRCILVILNILPCRNIFKVHLEKSPFVKIDLPFRLCNFIQSCDYMFSKIYLCEKITRYFLQNSILLLFESLVSFIDQVYLAMFFSFLCTTHGQSRLMQFISISRATLPRYYIDLCERDWRLLLTPTIKQCNLQK